MITIGILSGMIFLLVIVSGVIIMPALTIIALIDVFRGRFTGNNQLLMALVVLLVPLGAIIYYFIKPSVINSHC